MHENSVSSILRTSRFLQLVLVFRCSIDPILSITKVGGIGIGALLNIAIISYGCLIYISFIKKIPMFILKVWGVFILVGLLSIVWSPIQFNSTLSFASILTYPILFSLPFFLIKTKGDVYFLLKLIIISAIIPLVAGIAEIIIGLAQTRDLQGARVFSTFAHPNIFALYLLIVLALIFFILKTSAIVITNRVRAWLHVLALTSLVLLVFTQTRSAWAGCVMIILVYSILSQKRYLIYLCIGILIAVSLPAIQERLLNILSNTDINQLNQGDRLNSFAWRTAVWEASLDYIKSKLFLGYGYDTFSYYFLDFSPFPGNQGMDAHNVYLQVTFEMGLLGLIGLIIVFLSILLRLFKYRKLDKNGGSVIIGLVASYMLMATSDNLLFYLAVNWYLWFVCGLFCMLANRPDLIAPQSRMAYNESR